MFQTQQLILNKTRRIFLIWGICLSLLLVNTAFSQAAYIKEPEVEVLTASGASQAATTYSIITTVAQPTPTGTLSSGYATGASYRV